MHHKTRTKQGQNTKPHILLEQMLTIRQRQNIPTLEQTAAQAISVGLKYILKAKIFVLEFALVTTQLGFAPVPVCRQNRTQHTSQQLFFFLTDTVSSQECIKYKARNS